MCPVTTACFSVVSQEESTSEEWKHLQPNEIKDKEFLRFVAEKNIRYGFINIYCGETSQLSSSSNLTKLSLTTSPEKYSFFFVYSKF